MECSCREPALRPRARRASCSPTAPSTAAAPSARAPCASGEVCFNTSLTGYQEILTDPSYAGQIVAMTYPQIGNVGTNADDKESARPFLVGLRREGDLRRAHELALVGDAAGVPRAPRRAGDRGIDTRALVRRIRDHGFQNGVLWTDPAQQDAEALAASAREAPSLDGRDLVAGVTLREPYDAGPRASGRASRGSSRARRARRPRFRLVAYDFGVKRNILRLLVDHGFEVTVVPAKTTAAAGARARARTRCSSRTARATRPPSRACASRCASWRASTRCSASASATRSSASRSAARTSKLKFGHHGGNQPGKDLATGKVAICAENHGYAVEADSLRSAGEPVEITHVNLNDDTVEGLAHARRPLFSVQYHPEASPGPHDAGYFFERFREMVARHQAGERVSGAAVAKGA